MTFCVCTNYEADCCTSANRGNQIDFISWLDKRCNIVSSLSTVQQNNLSYFWTAIRCTKILEDKFRGKNIFYIYEESWCHKSQQNLIHDTPRKMTAHHIGYYTQSWGYSSTNTINVKGSMVSNSPERIAVMCHVGRTPLVVTVLLTQHILLQLLVELHSPQPNCTHVE
jgi:hypothetical protein